MYRKTCDDDGPRNDYNVTEQLINQFSLGFICFKNIFYNFDEFIEQ